MKKLLVLGTLALMTSNAFAITAAMTPIALLEATVHGSNDESFSMITASSTSAGLTSIASPIAGLVVFAKNGTAELDLNNEETIDEIEAIQISIEEGFKLSDFQKSMLDTGINAGQIDIDGTILE